MKMHCFVCEQDLVVEPGANATCNVCGVLFTRKEPNAENEGESGTGRNPSLAQRAGQPLSPVR